MPLRKHESIFHAGKNPPDPQYHWKIGETHDGWTRERPEGPCHIATRDYKAGYDYSSGKRVEADAYYKTGWRMRSPGGRERWAKEPARVLPKFTEEEMERIRKKYSR